MGEIFASVCDECRKKNKENIQEITNAFSKLETDIKDVCSCDKKIAELQEQITDLRCRSMKYNLIFSGLRYTPNENTEYVLRCFLRNELNIHENISFCNVHRFGKPGLNGAKPIVAKFIHRIDLDYVLENAYKLKGKPFGINEQFPVEIEEKRRRLYPVMKEAKKKGDKVKLVRDKLFINGEPYTSFQIERGNPQFTGAKAAGNQDLQITEKPQPIPSRPNKRNRIESEEQQEENIHV